LFFFLHTAVFLSIRPRPRFHHNHSFAHLSIPLFDFEFPGRVFLISIYIFSSGKPMLSDSCALTFRVFFFFFFPLPSFNHPPFPGLERSAVPLFQQFFGREQMRTPFLSFSFSLVTFFRDGKWHVRCVNRQPGGGTRGGPHPFFTRFFFSFVSKIPRGEEKLPLCGSNRYVFFLPPLSVVLSPLPPCLFLLFLNG